MDLALTNPGHNREGPKQTPDTLHTLSRHPTDTPQTPSRQRKIHILWLKIGNWEKMKYLLKTVVIGLFSIDFVFLPPRQYPDSPRHHPDTPRHHPDTPRHHPDTPTHRHFYALEVTGRTMQYLSVMTKYD